MLENERRYLVKRILKLRKERNAIILAHNYQLGEDQNIADFVGDSLGLSQNAVKTEAEVMVHSECLPEVVEIADVVKSTSGMCRYASETEAEEIIVGTEVGIIYRLRKENPGKKFIPVSEQAVCPAMKLTTLEDILCSLEKMSPQVKVPEEIRIRAKSAVDKMQQVG